ncbi:MAG: hypothetical protein L3K04_00885 [Thermoplasmata archaeon]|nr:hypothetical protein [Thermoplasmata archaeon]MCI4337698.1 hypothetical protein [Thermoplasmata archaeon]MCI4340828.1 hypothetical protein [Thermoplasmata archaeon]
MSGAAGGPERARVSGLRPESVALLLLVATGVLLGLSASVGALEGVAIPSAGIVGGLLCRRFLPGVGRTLSAIPIVAGLGAVAALDPISAPGELLAGGAGLALLLWLASEPFPRGRWRDAAGALLLPSLAVLLGILASVALPGAPNAFGAAAALLVTEILFAAWLYGHPAELADAGRSPAAVI